MYFEWHKTKDNSKLNRKSKGSQKGIQKKYVNRIPTENKESV